MEIDSTTQVAGLIGNPVRASLSPLLHNRAFQALGVNAVYLAFEVPAEGLERAVEGFRALKFLGVNVTGPYKERIMRFLDELSPEAKLAGAVNTIKPEGEVLKGYNTDGQGLLASLKEEGSFTPKGKKVLIIGAGGAVRGILVSLAQEEAKEIWVVNRTECRARALCQELAKKLAFPRLSGDSLLRLCEGDFLCSFDLVINATPPTARFPFLFDKLPKEALVCDLAYRPEGPPFLNRARGLGIRAQGGLGMLIHQAALSFEIWTGLPAPVAIMKKAVRAEQE